MNTTALIQPYLFFNGRCEEAIEFYKTALGAKVEMVMRDKESPEPHPPGMVPPGYEDKIMHASFRVGECVIMASDGCGDTSKFAAFSLSISLPTQDDAERVFAALSDGGNVNMPLTKTFWSPCFGMVEDRFGMAWMITVCPESSPK
jgi:PhnB protein